MNNSLPAAAAIARLRGDSVQLHIETIGGGGASRVDDNTDSASSSPARSHAVPDATSSMQDTRPVLPDEAFGYAGRTLNNVRKRIGAILTRDAIVSVFFAFEIFF